MAALNPEKQGAGCNNAHAEVDCDAIDTSTPPPAIEELIASCLVSSARQRVQCLFASDPAISGKAHATQAHRGSLIKAGFKLRN